MAKRTPWLLLPLFYLAIHAAAQQDPLQDAAHALHQATAQKLSLSLEERTRWEERFGNNFGNAASQEYMVSRLRIGMGYTHVSGQASDLDRDQRVYTNTLNYPIRAGETYLETTYQYQLTPWWQLQPDFQYVFHPGAGVVNPNSTTGAKVGNEAVFGVRMNFAF